jgi:hypothetical protein
MIICSLHGGFGNHILNTFLGIILHHYSKKQIHLISNKLNNDTNIQRNDTRTAIYKLINNNILSTRNTYTKIIHVNTPDSYYNIYNAIKNDSNSYFDCDICIDIIHINNMEFYFNHINIIDNYISIDSPNIDLSNSIVISLRLGMGKAEVVNPSPYEGELRLPFKYYRDIIDKLDKQYNNIYICSDNYIDKYINNFIDIFNNVILLNNYNTYEQFCILVNAPILISSNSSFSIMASLLNKNIVYFPKFVDSGTVFPGSINMHYAKILNNPAPNVINIDI